MDMNRNTGISKLKHVEDGQLYSILDYGFHHSIKFFEALIEIIVGHLASSFTAYSDSCKMFLI